MPAFTHDMGAPYIFLLRSTLTHPVHIVEVEYSTIYGYFMRIYILNGNTLNRILNSTKQKNILSNHLALSVVCECVNLGPLYTHVFFLFEHMNNTI